MADRESLFGAPRFRKKPLVIEAVQFTDVRSLKFIEAWSDGKVAYDDVNGVYCETLEGPLHVSDNDWVIRGVQGEFYPCKPDIFSQTYERVEGYDAGSFDDAVRGIETRGRDRA